MKRNTILQAAIIIVVFLFLSTISNAVSAQQANSKRNITIDDFFKLKNVGSPQISPDGKWLAYTVRSSDLKKDKSETRIWMIAMAGGEAIPMTAKGSSASSPRWSPDGKYLSFLATRDKGKTQVWTLDRRGGEAQQLTKIKQGVSGYTWSPDGKKLLLILKDLKPEDLEKDPEKKKKPKPWVIDRLQFKRDNIGYLDKYRNHLYVYTPGDSLPVQITSGEFDDSSPAWSPDGKTITYVTKTEPDKMWYATNHLAVISSAGGNPEVLTTALDRNVRSPRFSHDGKSIFFLLEDSAELNLARISRTGKNLTRLISGDRRVSGFTMNNQGKMTILISEPNLPTEVFVLENQKLRQLTQTNKKLLDKLNFAELENIHCNSKDGMEVEGFIFKPPGFDPKFRYPTLLRNHGGPVSQYDFGFKFEAQLFAANGYVVVMMNPRGSSGYGQDFSMAIWADWGNKDFEDVMAGVDYAIEKGYADPERLGVGGWSYGGILTNYVITKTDRFKGAITGASEVLYRSNYGHDHYQRDWVKELGLPWKNAEAWERISPFNYVENIVTPTLIMCGEKDWNVPVLNSEQLYQALRQLGRTTQLVVYPGQHHGIRIPTFQKDRFERYLAWYDKYVKNSAANK